MNPFFRSIRAKLLVFFLLIDFVALGFMIYSVSRDARKELESQIKKRIEFAILDMTMHFNDDIETKWDAVRELSQNPFIVNSVIDSLGRSEYLVPFMQKLSLPGKGLHDEMIWLTDYKGKVFANTPNAHVKSFENDHIVRNVLLTGKPFLKMVHDDNGKNHVMQYVFPVTYNRYVEGVIVVESRMSFAEEIAKREKEFTTSIVQFSGQVLLGDLPDNSIERITNTDTSAVSPEIFSINDTLYACRMMEDSKKFGTIDWVIVLSISDDKIFAPIGFMRERMIKVGFITALGISLVVFWRSRIFVAPIKQLQNTMHEIIEKGDLSKRVKVSSKDEVGQLAATFNLMIENLEKYTNEIELSKKMAAVGRLAAGVAHEINNPMTSILGFSQIIINKINETDPLYIPLKTIENEALRCKKLVTDLLAYSRTSKDEFEKCDINVLVNDTLSILKNQAKIMKIGFIEQFYSQPLVLMINKSKIQQVIINICGNAIDAMGSGGIITVATGKTNINNADYMELNISDTGSGIPVEIIGRIFEPFFTTKDVGKGTGLGLSLCYEIIKSHKGTIGVKSEIGKGTAFTVRLPLV